MLSQVFSDKTILIIATLVGMGLCTGGIGRVAAEGIWLQPMSLIGSGLGVLILVIVGAALFDIRLPLIDSPRAALIAVVSIAFAKVILTQLHVAIA